MQKKIILNQRNSNNNFLSIFSLDILSIACHLRLWQNKKSTGDSSYKPFYHSKCIQSQCWLTQWMRETKKKCIVTLEQWNWLITNISSWYQIWVLCYQSYRQHLSCLTKYYKHLNDNLIINCCKMAQDWACHLKISNGMAIRSFWIKLKWWIKTKNDCHNISEHWF